MTVVKLTDRGLALRMLSFFGVLMVRVCLPCLFLGLLVLFADPLLSWLCRRCCLRCSSQTRSRQSQRYRARTLATSSFSTARHKTSALWLPLRPSLYVRLFVNICVELFGVRLACLQAAACFVGCVMSFTVRGVAVNFKGQLLARVSYAVPVFACTCLSFACCAETGTLGIAIYNAMFTFIIVALIGLLVSNDAVVIMMLVYVPLSLSVSVDLSFLCCFLSHGSCVCSAFCLEYIPLSTLVINFAPKISAIWLVCPSLLCLATRLSVCVSLVVSVSVIDRLQLVSCLTASPIRSCTALRAT